MGTATPSTRSTRPTRSWTTRSPENASGAGQRIQAQRGGNPAERHFTILRIRGGGDLWVSECVISYDGAPTYSVSVMAFTGDLVSHETQYFADPFPAPAARAALAEHIPDRER